MFFGDKLPVYKRDRAFGCEGVVSERTEEAAITAESMLGWASSGS